MSIYGKTILPSGRSTKTYSAVHTSSLTIPTLPTQPNLTLLLLWNTLTKPASSPATTCCNLFFVLLSSILSSSSSESESEEERRGRSPVNVPGGACRTGMRNGLDPGVCVRPSGTTIFLPPTPPAPPDVLFPFCRTDSGMTLRGTSLCSPSSKSNAT